MSLNKVCSCSFLSWERGEEYWGWGPRSLGLVKGKSVFGKGEEEDYNRFPLSVLSWDEQKE